jgi:hypothetical protein
VTDVDNFQLIKTDSSGNPVWSQTYGLIGIDEDLTSLIQTSDGGYALVGDTHGGSHWPSGDFYIVKTDMNGLEEWDNIGINIGIGGLDDDMAYCVIQTSDGGLAIAGFLNHDAALIKFSSVVPGALQSKDSDWYWISDTRVASVATGDVDGDGAVEIVTGGYYFNGTGDVALLVVWDGATLAYEKVQPWYWTSDTRIASVAVGNVDGDAAMEIVTGGTYDDGTRLVAQLVVWNGATLALENGMIGYWIDDTVVNSVAIGDVDGDAQIEIVTGGCYFDGTRDVAQLCVWDGYSVPLALENVVPW